MPTPSFLSNRYPSLPLLRIQLAGGMGITYSPLWLPNNCPSPALSTLVQAHLCIYGLSYIFSAIFCCPLGHILKLYNNLSTQDKIFYSLTSAIISFLHFSMSNKYNCGPLRPLCIIASLSNVPPSRLWSLYFPCVATLPFLPPPVSIIEVYLILSIFLSTISCFSHTFTLSLPPSLFPLLQIYSIFHNLQSLSQKPTEIQIFPLCLHLRLVHLLEMYKLSKSTTRN